MKRRAERAMHEIIYARVLCHEKQAIAQAAKCRGVSASDFIRQAISEAALRVVG